MSPHTLRHVVLFATILVTVWYSVGGWAGVRNPRFWIPFLVAMAGLALAYDADRNIHDFQNPAAFRTMEMVLGGLIGLGGFFTAIGFAGFNIHTVRRLVARRTDWLLGELDGAGYSLEELDAAEKELVELQGCLRWTRVAPGEEWVSAQVVARAIQHVRLTRSRALPAPIASEANRK